MYIDFHLAKLYKMIEFFSISKGLYRFGELYVCAHEKSASSCKYKCYLRDIVVNSIAKIHQTFTLCTQFGNSKFFLPLQFHIKSERQKNP